jgi:DNA-binding response OmpR family regulator
MPRLVIIDTDDRQRRWISSTLTSLGSDMLEASGSIEGLLLVLDSSPSAILLAENMPPLRAADLLRALRQVSNAPIIVIGTGGEPEEVAALEAGADAYVPPAAGLRLLVARVNSLLRRYRPLGNPSAYLAWPLGPISLTDTERRLMTSLINHNGRPVTLGELSLEVWGGGTGVDNVKYHLRQLRQKLDRQPCGLKLLCIRGVGYRLVLAETQSRAGQDSAVAASSECTGKQVGVA